MKILVTAGPTREPLDPVRFLGNRSSGKMGYAFAEALMAAGHQVVLVSGPVALKSPSRVKVIAVETAREMLAACRREWPGCDGLVAAAAVADWRPAKTARKKLDGSGPRTLSLVPNPDILATLARRKGNRQVVGFALQDRNGEKKALMKLEKKGMDWVILNGLVAQGASSAEVVLLGKDGSREKIGPSPKKILAKALVRRLFPSP